MSTNALKFIAAATMVADHVGFFFFPDAIWLRYIGRISFPIFAWLIALGAERTHDIYAYARRVLVLAVVSQIPFTIANQIVGGQAMFFNILFGFFLALMAITLWRSQVRDEIKIAAIVAAPVLAAVLNIDYGAAGVLSILAFFYFRNDGTKNAVTQTLILGILPFVSAIATQQTGIPLWRAYLASTYEWFALLALPLIWLHTPSPARAGRNRWFYYFYPAHYVAICAALFLRMT